MIQQVRCQMRINFCFIEHSTAATLTSEYLMLLNGLFHLLMTNVYLSTEDQPACSHKSFRKATHLTELIQTEM